jgi:hypothetical protein
LTTVLIEAICHSPIDVDNLDADADSMHSCLSITSPSETLSHSHTNSTWKGHCHLIDSPWFLQTRLRLFRRHWMATPSSSCLTNDAKQSKQLKWVKVLVWKWVNRGRIRYASISIGLDRIFWNPSRENVSYRAQTLLDWFSVQETYAPQFLDPDREFGFQDLFVKHD